MARMVWVFPALLSALLSGCGKKNADMPTTYPATGRVVHKDGKPLAGASVQFHTADATLTISGVTDDDGKFTLSTIKGNTKVAGAVPGEYKVTIFPPVPSDHRAVQPIALPKSYKVEERDNTYTFTVPRPIISGKGIR